MQTEQRQSVRRVFKTRALLAVEGASPMLGRTTDIGANGVSVAIPNPVPAGQVVQVRFDLLVEGTSVTINTRARTQYCILSSGEFRVGLEFLQLEPGVSSALSRFLR